MLEVNGLCYVSSVLVREREGGREQPIVLLAIEGWCNYHGAGDEVRMREERSCPPTLHLALL